MEKLCEVCSGFSYDEYQYRCTLTRLSAVYIDYLPEVKKANGYESIRKNFHVQIDHIVPRWFGEQQGFSVYEMAGVDNIQVMSGVDNSIKGNGKSGYLPDVWFSYLTEVVWVYSCGEYSSKYLHEVCDRVGVSYIKAASQLIKNLATEIRVGDKVILRKAA